MKHKPLKELFDERSRALTKTVDAMWFGFDNLTDFIREHFVKPEWIAYGVVNAHNENDSESLKAGANLILKALNKVENKQEFFERYNQAFIEAATLDKIEFQEKIEELEEDLNKIRSGYQKTKNHQAKLSFMEKAKGVEITPQNKNGIMSLDFVGEYLADNTLDTLFKWYKDANPSFKAKRGGDNRKANQ